MEQIKAFTTEMDEIMTVKLQQAKKIKQLQAELETLQKQQGSKISFPSKTTMTKFLQHLVDD